MKTHLTIGFWLLTCVAAVATEGPLALQPGPASDTTAAYCSVCHTTDYIIMNSRFLTPQAWKAEVAKMRTLFGAPIDDETATAITAYLAANYAADSKP